MKFLVMLTADQADYDAMSGRDTARAWSRQDLDTMYAHMGALNEDLVASGELVEAQGLAEPAQARLVSADPHGTPVVSDGPYGVEERVPCGFWLVECAGRERAVEIAVRAWSCPVPVGTPKPPVVVHPVDEGEP